MGFSYGSLFPQHRTLLRKAPAQSLLICALLIQLATLLFPRGAWSQAPPSPSAGIDSDGDGVPDSQDCAPADPRIAKAHTYYFDLDADTFGDSSHPISLCSVAPFPGTAVWGTDANDSDNTAVGPIIAKGKRTLGIDFLAPAQNGAWRADLARELGADAMPILLTWSGLESSPGTFNGPDAGTLTQIANAAENDTFALNLTISPFMRTFWTMPPDIVAGLQAGTARLTDPAVIARFNALLDFVHAKLNGVPLTSLQIGHEVDPFLVVRPDPQFWIDFSAFFSAVQAHAKILWGGTLPVGITGTWSGELNGPSAGLMAQLNGIADIVSVTYFPRTPTFEVEDPSLVRGEIEQLIQAYYPKPIYLESAGYPSAPLLGSSSTRQSQFLYALFEVWDTYAASIPYLGITYLHDPSPAAAAAYIAQGYLGVPADNAANATAYFASLGLRTFAGAGSPKSGYYTLRNLTLNRGWWRVRPASSRSFLIGFTTAPYDGTPGGPMIDSVTNYTGQVIGAIADMVSFYFDGGVPWVEAYNDTFSSSIPPYSANLIGTWSKSLASKPPGAKLAVAINPLGIPRTQLAPYWGIGEGFYLDSNFNQVGTGVIQDYQNRLLPSPWNTYTLDSPQVKTAYLNYCRRVLDYFHPDYLIAGIEVNLAVQNPSFFAQYVSLEQYVYRQLRLNPAYSRTKIVVSFTSEQIETDEFGVPVLIDGVQQPTLAAQNVAAIEQVLPYLDVLGLSIYPAKTRFGTYTIPAATIDNIFGQIRSFTDKPIAITETGYPAQTFKIKNLFFPTSPEKQATYLKLLFADVQKWGSVEFVTNFSVRDQTAFLDKLRASSLWTPPYISPDLVEFFNYFEFIGVIDAAGNLRPAADVWVNEFGVPLQRAGQNWATPLSLLSPDGATAATFYSDQNGHLVYQIGQAGVDVLDPSPLGPIVDGIDLGSQVSNIDVSSTVEINESYPVRGIHATAMNHCWEYTLRVRRAGAGDLEFPLVVRVYNDGVAYRYLIPGNTPRMVMGESSAWQIPDGSALWFQDNTNNYESTFWPGLITQVGDKIGGPVTFYIANGGPYLVLNEAALIDYSGMTYRADVGSHLVRSQFLDDWSWTVNGGSPSPWRVAIISSTLNGLVNSDMVNNLSASPDPVLFPDGEGTAWIKPGRAVWSWWSDRSSAGSYDTQVQYVDYAAKLRFEYVVVDNGWEAGFPANGEDQFARMADLANYAQSKGVGIWAWKELSEVLDPAARHSFFLSLKLAGVVGVKIDNIYGFGSESVATVNIYADILQDAAQLKLMIDFHGVNKPTGLFRTYPNLVAYEGIMGLEADAFWQLGLFVPAHHDAVIPFTRMVAGPMDYTPLTLDPRKLGSTTFTHQLATTGAFTSPLQSMAENPALVLAQPLIEDYLRAMPTTWDETTVLPQSIIGEVAIIAHRKLDRWYLFVVGGDEQQAITISGLPLSFLGAGAYRATFISDATPTSFAEQSQSGVTSSSMIDIPLLVGGGFVAVFSPQPSAGAQLMQGFSSTPAALSGAGFSQTYMALAAHANLVEHTFPSGVPWPEALTSADYHSYAQSLQAYWNLYSAADQAVPNLTRAVALSPIDLTTFSTLAPYWSDSGATLPAPWNQYSWNDPAVKTAYLNYALAAVNTLQPAYLALSIDANRVLAASPGQWMAFRDLIAYVYQGVKQVYPKLIIFSSIRNEDLLGITDASRNLAIQTRETYPNVLENEVKALMNSSDIVAISSTPYAIANNPYFDSNGQLDGDYFDEAFRLAQSLGKPLAFERIGASSQPVALPSALILPGSEAMQQAFINAVLSAAEVRNAAFVVNFLADDYGMGYGTTADTIIWAYAGLIRLDGSAKPALAVWDAYRAGNPPQ